MSESENELLTPIQAAEFLGVSKNTLCVWRSLGRYNVPYIKVGRLIRYRKNDLKEWLERRYRKNGETDKTSCFKGIEK
jgi:excisionase family DNA binding protein